MSNGNNVTRRGNNSPSNGPQVVIINVTPVGTKTNWGWKIWTLFRDYILKPIMFVLWHAWQHRRKILWAILGLVGLYVGYQLVMGAMSLARDGWHILRSWFDTAAAPTSWGRIGVIAILFFLSSGFFWWRVRRLWKVTRMSATPGVNPSGSPASQQTSSEEHWLVNPAWLFGSWGFILLVAAPVLAEHLAPNYGWNWWFKTVLRTPMGGMLVTAFIIMGWMTKENKKSRFRWAMAQTSIYILTAIALTYIGSETSAKSFVMNNLTSLTAPGRSAVVTTTGPTHSAIVQKTISDAVFARLPYSEAVALVARAQEESGFRQFNDDGSILRGEVNPKDVCAFQINEDYWLEKAKELGHDIYTLNGCIEMALVIYKERGLDAWNTLKGVENVNKSERAIEAPVGKTVKEAGELIQVPVGSNCHGIPDKPVIAWDDHDLPHEVTPTKIPAFFTTTLRYSTPDEPIGHIKYVCR